MSYKVRYQVDLMKISGKVIQDQLDAGKIPYHYVRPGEFSLKKALSEDQEAALFQALTKYGVTIIQDRKDSMVQQIKDAINDMVYKSENLQMTTSAYLEEKLNKSYSSISKTFKENTYTSIENYIILRKVERAKELIIADQHTLTEIAYMLNYSSVAHLSTQFKKTTGLSASTFLRIIKKRQNNTVKN